PLRTLAGKAEDDHPCRPGRSLVRLLVPVQPEALQRRLLIVRVPRSPEGGVQLPDRLRGHFSGDPARVVFRELAADPMTTRGAYSRLAGFGPAGGEGSSHQGYDQDCHEITHGYSGTD